MLILKQVFLLALMGNFKPIAMRHLFIFLLISLSSLHGAFGQSEQAWLDQGTRAFNEKDFDMAIIYFEQVIEINPKNHIAYNNLGWVYFQKGNTAEASANAVKAIELSPTYSVAYKNLAFYKLSENNMGESFSMIQKAIELNKKDSYALSLRGRLYMYTKEKEKAMLDFNEAIKLDSKNTEAITNRAYLYLLDEKYVEAIEDYGNYIALDTLSFAVYSNRALALLKVGQYDVSYADFRKAHLLNPENTKVYANMIYAKYLSGKEKEACVEWKAAIDNGNTESRYFYVQYCTANVNPGFTITINGRHIQENAQFEIKLTDAIPLLDAMNVKPNSELIMGTIQSNSEKLSIIDANNTKVEIQRWMISNDGGLASNLADVVKKTGYYDAYIIFTSSIDEIKRINFKLKIVK